MSYRFLLVSLLGLTAATTAQARGLDISLGNDTAQINYLAKSDSQIGIGGTEFGGGVLFNEDDDAIFNFGVLVTGNSVGQNRALQLGAGARAYFGKLGNLDCEDHGGDADCDANDDPDNDAVAAVAIGGKVAYIFPSRTPISLSLEAYLAPDVTSFGDNEDFLEVTVRFELEVAPTTRFFVGYRNMEVEMEDFSRDYDVDESAHLGVRFAF
jgi:hypothetical protein